MFRAVNVKFTVQLASAVSQKDVTLPVTWYVQHRTIVSKKFYVPAPNKVKPPPFPYKDKLFSYETRLFDHMYQRFDENTRLIVVDGQISVGKHEIAQKIAEELDFKFFPDITTDTMYINEYGYDFRNLDYKLPESVQSYDEKKFNMQPTHFNAAAFQANKYRLRYAQYFDCLAHLMNTGQGVVVVRSPYSDCVFANAMADVGYMSEPALYTYNEIVRHTMLYLLRPHLYIHIGASVEATMKNIKNKNVSWIAESKALTPQFIEAMNRYFRNYILGASLNSMVLQYDWSEGGDIEIVIEDIERLDFDTPRHWTDPKLIDWNMEEEEAEDYRYIFTRQKVEYMNNFGTPCVYEAPEMFSSGNDLEVWVQVYEAAPGNETEPGFNPKRGDKVWWKIEDRGYKWHPMG